MANEKLIKVKILKYVGRWTPGQIVEVDQDIANVLCGATVQQDGQYIYENQKAVLLSEVEHMESTPLDFSKMSMLEMAKIGKKNIVETPKNAALDKKLEKYSNIIANKNEPKQEKTEKYSKAK